MSVGCALGLQSQQHRVRSAKRRVQRERDYIRHSFTIRVRFRLLLLLLYICPSPRNLSLSCHLINTRARDQHPAKSCGQCPFVVMVQRRQQKYVYSKSCRISNSTPVTLRQESNASLAHGHSTSSVSPPPRCFRPTPSLGVYRTDGSSNQIERKTSSLLTRPL